MPMTKDSRIPVTLSHDVQDEFPFERHKCVVATRIQSCEIGLCTMSGLQLDEELDVRTHRVPATGCYWASVGVMMRWRNLAWKDLKFGCVFISCYIRSRENKFSHWITEDTRQECDERG